MKYLKLQEYPEKGYRGRTKHNANSADITIAVAVDFNTAGERLTKAVACERGEERYIASHFNENPHDCAQKLLERMIEFGFASINIAGNGVYTLSDYGYTQEDANLWVYTLLTEVDKIVKISFLVSGCQTGIDLAGAVSSVLMEKPFTGTLPNGWVQRWEDGVDRSYDKLTIRNKIMSYVYEME